MFTSRPDSHKVSNFSIQMSNFEDFPFSKPLLQNKSFHSPPNFTRLTYAPKSKHQTLTPFFLYKQSLHIPNTSPYHHLLLLLPFLCNEVSFSPFGSQCHCHLHLLPLTLLHLSPLLETSPTPSFFLDFSGETSSRV